MSPVASTFEVPLTGLESAVVPLQWQTMESQIMSSIMLGIEQARRNEGTLLTDGDLAADDNEE